MPVGASVRRECSAIKHSHLTDTPTKRVSVGGLLGPNHAGSVAPKGRSNAGRLNSKANSLQNTHKPDTIDS